MSGLGLRVPWEQYRSASPSPSCRRWQPTPQPGEAQLRCLWCVIRAWRPSRQSTVTQDCPCKVHPWWQRVSSRGA